MHFWHTWYSNSWITLVPINKPSRTTRIYNEKNEKCALNELLLLTSTSTTLDFQVEKSWQKCTAAWGAGAVQSAPLQKAPEQQGRQDHYSFPGKMQQIRPIWRAFHPLCGMRPATWLSEAPSECLHCHKLLKRADQRQHLKTLQRVRNSNWDADAQNM